MITVTTVLTADILTLRGW